MRLFFVIFKHWILDPENFLKTKYLKVIKMPHFYVVEDVRSRYHLPFLPSQIVANDLFVHNLSICETVMWGTNEVFKRGTLSKNCHLCCVSLGTNCLNPTFSRVLCGPRSQKTQIKTVCGSSEGFAKSSTLILSIIEKVITCSKQR